MFRKKHRHILYILVGTALGAAAVFLGYSTYLYLQSGIEEHGVILKEVPGQRAVHWHAKLEMYACGKLLRLPLNRGTPLLHTHKDPQKIHIEGLIREGENVTLGDFMDAVGVFFAKDKLFDYKNNGGCPDEGPDKVQIIVNGKLDDRFRDHPLQDGDLIILIYD